jgi:glycosyltransferase involved in cell wall biosynthesis
MDALLPSAALKPVESANVSHAAVPAWGRARSDTTAAPRRPRVLYIASRFPVATETFVVNEWETLSGRLDMAFAALQRTGEPPLSDQSRRLLPRVRFADALARPTIRANASLLARRPRTYARVVVETVRGSVGQKAGGVGKGLVVLWKAAALARYAQRSSVDHVHAHFASHPATAAWVIHRFTGLPYSFTAHANDIFRGPALLPEKVRDASFVAACGEYPRARLRERVPDVGRVHAIHLGVDLERFPPSRAERQRRRRLLCVASFQPKKAQGDLVRALALLAPELPDIELDLVGHGPEYERVVRLAAALGVQDRVTMHGWLGPSDVQHRLAQADIFVLPSIRLPDGRMEGVPTVLMEALASGLPVVATDLSGVPELVLHERTGLLVAPGRPPELAGAIRRLVEDPALATRLAEEGRRHVAAHFDLRRQAGIMGDLFERSVAGRPADLDSTGSDGPRRLLP